MMKTEHKVLASALLMGILVAVIDALLDFLFFYEGTFLEILIFNIPPHEFYIRSVVVICFISFGFVVGRVLNQREQAVEHSEYLYSVLSAIRNVNQLIVKETNQEVLLQRACELLIETRAYSHSWIVMFNADGQLTGSASAGLGIEFEQMLEMIRKGERPGCMKKSMEQSGVLVFDVPPLEHEACPIEPLCKKGVALVTRLESRVGIHGVLGVGTPVDMATEEELSLFKEVADDIAYALYTFEVEDKGSRAHVALIENEKRFRLLYEDAPLCYQSLDEAGRFVEVNKAWLHYLEYSREEVIGRSFEEFLAPEEWNRFWAIFSQFKEIGEIHDVEFWMIRKDGSRFIASYDGAFTRGHSKQGKVCHCIFRDVTEQRRMEDELEESEKQHRMILSSMNDMIFVLDEHDCYSEFYASPSLMPYTTPEEFLGKSVADIMPLELAEQMIELIKRVRETGNRETLEYTLQMNENELWFSAALDLHQDGESIVAVVREITKRKRTELALHNVNRALRAMIEINAIVVQAQDELKMLSDVCQVLVDICGYRLAWVGFAEHDKNKTVRPVAQWGFEEGYLRTVDIAWSDTERGRGPTGTAIRTGEPITVLNIQEDPKYTPWKAEATERGYACAIALPLFEDEHPIGALNIYAKELDAFNPDEVNLLMELASSLAYSIKSVRTHVERMEAQKALKDSEERSRTLLQSMHDLVFVIDKHDCYTQYYTSSKELLFIPAEEFMGRPVSKVLPQLVAEQFTELSRRVRDTGESESFDYQLEASGQRHWFSAVLSLHEDGESIVQVVRNITRRKQAEVALRKERDSAQMYLHIAGAMLVALDADGRVTLMNRKGCEILGYDAEEIIGKNWFNTFLPERLGTDVRGVFAQLMAGDVESVEYYENPVLKKNGDEKLILWHNSLLTDEAGKIVGILSSGEDITERKKAEAALRVSEKMYRLLAENTFDCIWQMDLNTEFTYVNPAVFRVFGFTPDEWVGSSLGEHCSPEDMEFMSDLMTETIRKGTYASPEKFEVRMLRKDCKEIDVEITAELILDKDNNPMRFQGTTRNITERKLATEQLRESERMYRALFESANDAIFIMRDNLFIECNDIALKMFGCNREEILFHSPDEFSPKLQPDGSPSKKRALKRIRATLAGEPQFFEWKHTRCDGAFFDAEVGLNAVQVGDELAVQAIVRDITGRKRAEKEIKATSETASLYLDLMGHDIRNHLQAIVMGIEILTSTDLDANLSSVTDLITESVERSRNLIQKVQVTRGLLSAPLTEKPLRVALEESLDVLKKTYEDLEIKVDYRIRRAKVSADQYLDNLLMNLLDNAIIHNSKRSRRVWVSLREAKEGYEISIADNGPGISDEMKESLFDREKRFGGVGIHQALRIAQKYGGHISIDDRVANDPSQGAKFQLWLPKLDASAS